MNPWSRLGLLFGALIVSALLLKLLPPIVVLVLFVGGVAGVNHALRSRQRAEPERTAASVLGLERVEAERSGVSRLPCARFGRATMAIRDVMRGWWGGAEVTIFDIELTPSAVGGAAAARNLTGAVASVDIQGPHLVVEPRALLLPPLDLPEVAIGSERFREGFDVRCRDEPFARSFLDEGWTDWLIADRDRWGFELDPGRALLYGDRVAVGQRAEILDALDALVERLRARQPDGSAEPPTPPDEPTG